MPNTGKQFPACCNGCFAGSFFRFYPVVEFGDQAVWAMADVYVCALV